jgi:hypothetical protein
MKPFPPRFYVLAAVSLFVASLAAGAANSQNNASSGAQVKPGQEIVSLRTSHSRTFSVKGGVRRTVIYQEPVNYRDGGKWKAIDNELVAAREHGHGYRNHANRYSLRVPPKIGDKAVRIANEGDWLDLELEGSHGAPSIEGNTATYDVSRGVTVTYIAGTNGIEAKLRLENARVPSSYRLVIDTNKGLSLTKVDGQIVAVDSQDRVRFSLRVPSVVDDAGEIATDTELVLDRRSSRYVLTLRIDRDWLRDQDRFFPVEAVQAVEVARTDADGNIVDHPTTDCLIQDGLLKNASLCSAPILGTGAFHAGHRRTLLRFDIAESLPAGAKVLSAQLGLYEWRNSGHKNAPVDLHLLTERFTSSATWKRYDAGHSWAAAGGDFVESTLASTTPNAARGFESWDVSDLSGLQAIADGSSENNGFLLKQQNERVNAAHSFLSSEYWNATLRPRLEISYEPQAEDFAVPHAPELSKTGFTPFMDQTSFLYAGQNPVQTGVAEGTIEPIRAAVIRGKVTTRDGDPLPGVTVSVLDHPEFGQTKSRVDGSIYLAVNGDGLLTVVLEKDGYLKSQRQIDVPWQDYVWIDDVVLVPLDSQVTEVDSDSGAVQIARGTPVSDSDGTRQGTLIFQPGTTATMTMPDGSQRALDRASVRITEYTVGDSGPEAMPAELPPTSAYTYAAEFSVDEALSAGASEVTFDKPVISYTENFVGFDVGSPVPVGYYDRAKGQWVAQKNGRVIVVLSITGGLAALDVDGSGEVATTSALETLGITDQERRELAALYQPGRSLWRVPVTHFTPYDCNWPGFSLWPSQDDPTTNGPDDNSCSGSGCEISIENQSLGESAQIAGTPFKLDYQSERTPGRVWVVHMPLTARWVDSTVKRVDLRISIAGTEISKSFTTEPDQDYSFTWDGKDAFGRTLIGGQTVNISVGYVFDGDYAAPANSEQSFGLQGSGETAQPMRTERTNWVQKRASVRTWDSRAAGLGGWTLDINHTYDATSRTLFGSNGSQRSVAANPVAALQETLVAGGSTDWSVPGDGGPASKAFLSNPVGTKVARDGTIYVVEPYTGRIRRIGPDAIITTFAGNRSAADSLGDGGPAADAWLSQPEGIVLGPDDSVYVADSGHGRIRRIAPSGIITTVAGGGGENCEGGSGLGDGGPATAVALCDPSRLAVAPDGSIYFGEGTLLRRIGTDGTLSTVANGGSSGGGPVTLANRSASAETAAVDDFGDVGSIAVSRDGSIYFVAGRDTVRKITSDGTMTTLAGHHEPGGGGGQNLMSSNRTMTTAAAGETNDAGSEADLGAEIWPVDIAMAANGSLLIAEYDDVLRLDTAGTVTRVPTGNLNGLGGIAYAPNGDIYLTGADYTTDGRVYGYVKELGPPLPGFSDSDITIASEDGQSLDVFDGTGRHLKTVDALTGADIYRFSYDSAGWLSAVKDGNGDMTHIERSSDGTPSAIVGPFGQRTALQVDANGYLSLVVNPAGESINVQTAANGLLQSFTDANGGTNHFNFDAYGLLTADKNAAGDSQTFTRSETRDGHSVVLATPLGRETTYSVAPLSGGGVTL